jgi:hypothetical protein
LAGAALRPRLARRPPVTGLQDDGTTGRRCPVSSRSRLTSPTEAGKQIVDAVEKGSYRLRIGGDARLLDRLSWLMPRRATAPVANRMASLLES